MNRILLSHNFNHNLKKQQIHSVVEQFDTFFEDAAKNSFLDLQQIIERQNLDLYEISNNVENILEKESGQNEYDSIPSEVHELWFEMASIEHEISLSKEKLLALMEMKIISLYKSYEIAQKELISTAYKDINIRELYLWANVKEFFNTKGFGFGRINGYDYINQLRIVNNNIKHSQEIDKEVIGLKLPCFNGLTYFTADSLELFYKRVCKEPPKFLVTLSKLIVKDLYEFNDDRLEFIARKYTERMDKATLLKLSKAIEKEIENLPKKNKFNLHSK